MYLLFLLSLLNVAKTVGTVFSIAVFPQFFAFSFQSLLEV